MIPVFSAEQMHATDQYTILHEPVSSVDLMERAAAKCAKWFIKNIDKQTFVFVFCGPGNNGGDGLALTRMLYQEGYRVQALLCGSPDRLSDDNRTNLIRLQEIESKLVEYINTETDLPSISPDAVIIDALFGTGFSRVTDGFFGRVICRINETGCRVIAIDIPSGIHSDETSLIAGNNIIKASVTLTFQYPKAGLLVPENVPFVGELIMVDIGLMAGVITESQIKNWWVDKTAARNLLPVRPAEGHKGDFGHGLLVCGGEGKAGAGILAARGFLHSGAGLLTCSPTEEGIPVMYTSVPEAMVISRSRLAGTQSALWTGIGIGPGLGTSQDALELVEKVISFGKPLVMDADALNLMASNPRLLDKLPAGSVITPHPGEFKRLVGSWQNDFEKMQLQREFAMKHSIILVLKGHHTTTCDSDGRLFFNSTGNAGMAKGGSGDVLTGLITGLVSRGMSAIDAAVLGVFLHGLAGDQAAKHLTTESMQATDLINYLPEGWKKLTY
jgi:ADP-dependent NAD(P)H-hydrate dehydratase / NAD(P)H-hydrate epimerase